MSGRNYSAVFRAATDGPLRTCTGRHIHPFRDFNGRTIRVFLLELLRCLDLPRVELAPPTDAGRAHYFTALEAANRRDLGLFVAI